MATAIWTITTTAKDDDEEDDFEIDDADVMAEADSTTDEEK